MPMSKTEVDWSALDAILQFKNMSLVFCADYLGVSKDAIKRRIKEKYNMTFGEYAKLKQGRTALKLQQKAVQEALGSDKRAPNTTLMIFALKNLANWSDKIENTVESSGFEIKMSYDPNAKRTT